MEHPKVQVERRDFLGLAATAAVVGMVARRSRGPGCFSLQPHRPMAVRKVIWAQ
jgi:hypothetical protein